MTSHTVVPKTSTKKSFLVIFDDFSTLSIPRLVCPLVYPHGKFKLEFEIRYTKMDFKYGKGTPLFTSSQSETFSWYTPLPMIIHIPETIPAQKNTTYNASETCRGYVWTIMYFLHNDTTQSHLILDIFSSRVHPHNTRIFQNSSQSSDNVDSWSKLPSKCG